MAPRREHGLQADRGHVACVVAPHLAQASDAWGPATPPYRRPERTHAIHSILRLKRVITSERFVVEKKSI